MAVSRVSSRICEAGNKMCCGGEGCRLRLQEAVPSSQTCSPRRCPGEVRPTIRPPCLPFRPTRPAASTGTPNTRAWPHARPRTLTSRSRPCLLWPPLRTGRGGRGARGGPGAEPASVALGTGGGALALQLRHRQPDSRRPRRGIQWGPA